jgi:primase-polymerase (primpol)-like protein
MCYALIPKPDGTGNDKVPVDTAGRAANAHDPKNWMTYQAAQAAADRLGPSFGVAFDLTENDPWFFLDLDKCLDTATNQWKPEAVAIFQAFPGAWVEVSSSGTGLHIMGKCRVADLQTKRNKWGGWLEFYTKSRFIAFGKTGWSKIGGVEGDFDWTDTLRSWVPDRQNLGDLPVGVDPRWTGPVDDEDLIAKMLASTPHGAGAIFSGKATATDLWNANVEVLARCYPAFSGVATDFDHSAADSALLAHLAFWTGRDMPRMDRLFRRSALMREKYRLRDDYRAESIQNAARLCRTVYDRPAPVAKAAPAVAPEVYLTIQEQIEHFKGCVYIRDVHRVMVEGGAMLKSEQFNAYFGGHIFQMQPDGTGPTKKAFEAFTENRAHKFPQALRPCFRPDLAPGLILNDGSVNTYYPPNVAMVPGDASPFTNLLAKLLPVQSDRDILLAYLAAVVQYPGVKFQWAPVLQGCEGNGKTAVFSTVAHAVGRAYTHSPKAEHLSSQFNGYVEGKIFILVEEVHMQGKREMLDVLKPLITNIEIEIEGKGVDKRMIENRSNWGFCTNHRDAVIKSKNDRRYSIFFTAQQAVEDLKRDGMSGSYFPNLYSWLREGQGYAIVAHYLKTYPIPDHLNPATSCHRAPETSSTTEAIKQSLGGAEVEIIEAANDNTRGFREGWVSSWALEELLRRKGFRISRNRQSEILRDLGYAERGRSSRAILEEDGKRPILYRNREGGEFSDYLKAQAYAS